MSASVFKDLILWNNQSYDIAQFRLYVDERVEQTEEWERDIYSFVQEWLDDGKDQFSVNTSGSTGEAKKIQLSRKQMIASALATGDYLGLKPKDKALLCLPAQFIAGKMMLVRALVLGLDLYYLAPKVSILLEVTQSYDFVAMIPLQLQFGLDAKLFSKIEGINQIIIGGAPLSKDYIKQLAPLKSQCYATYGMTETITHIAMRRLNGKTASKYYTCLPGIRVQKDLNECLQINSERLPSKLTITNDRVNLINDQEFEVLGRADFIINSGGLKIQPEDLEEKLKTLLAFDFIISSKSDPVLGQKLVLIIEAQKGEVNEEELGLSMEKLLPKNKIPKEIFFISQIIRTKNHKIDRQKNREMIS